MANAITFARVVLIFVVIAVWAREGGVNEVWVDLAMVPLLAWAIFMDALDGWAARRWHEESDAGALFDIAGDRIVELALWTFFAIRQDASGQPFVAFWVPLVIITRTVLTDLVRSVAFGQGKTPFGSKGMQASEWARQLTASRWSRGAYGILKAVCFCALGLLLAWPNVGVYSELGAVARLTVDVLVYATTVFAVVRAIPVLWDGRRYLGAPSLRQSADASNASVTSHPDQQASATEVDLNDSRPR
jgi:CDP-diacylglycerol--glycerol-3-phosphate 3-phosphatidyltransferase